jgi:hypothetical protein
MILPETLFQDLRYGARMLRRNPGCTAVAVIALALGIRVNTAVFSAYKAMVARPGRAQAETTIIAHHLRAPHDPHSESFLFCFWPSRCLPLIHRPGAPCALIPWWRSDTSEA